jgi:hypothetical protein
LPTQFGQDPAFQLIEGRPYPLLGAGFLERAVERGLNGGGVVSGHTKRREERGLDPIAGQQAPGRPCELDAAIGAQQRQSSLHGEHDRLHASAESDLARLGQHARRNDVGVEDDSMWRSHDKA